MGRRRSLVRAAATVLVFAATVVGFSGDEPVHKAPAMAVTLVGSSSTPSGSSTGSTPGDVADHGIVTGPTGTCTCAGGGVYQQGSANEAKPHP